MESGSPTYYLLKYQEPGQPKPIYFAVNSAGKKVYDFGTSRIDRHLSAMGQYRLLEGKLISNVPEKVMKIVFKSYMAPDYISRVNGKKP